MMFLHPYRRVVSEMHMKQIGCYCNIECYYDEWSYYHY